MIIVFRTVIKISLLHAFNVLNDVKKGLRLFIGDVGHHYICRAIGDELLFHHI